MLVYKFLISFPLAYLLKRCAKIQLNNGFTNQADNSFFTAREIGQILLLNIAKFVTLTPILIIIKNTDHEHKIQVSGRT